MRLPGRPGGIDGAIVSGNCSAFGTGSFVSNSSSENAAGEIGVVEYLVAMYATPEETTRAARIVVGSIALR